MPESPSVQVKCTVTSVLYQPLPLGEVVAAATIVGAVLSILNEWRAAPAATVLPARSVKAGLSTLTAAPSPLLVVVPVFVGDGPVKPESVSVAVNVATTSVLFQPARFTAG